MPDAPRRCPHCGAQDTSIFIQDGAQCRLCLAVFTRREHNRGLFLRLWTAAAAVPGYDKDDWIYLQVELGYLS